MKPHERKVIDWDIALYYYYLPAAIIEGDLKLEEPILNWQDRKVRLGEYKNAYVAKMPLGTAVFYSPFFLLAHWLSPLLGYPQDGFNNLYPLALILSAVFFGLLGLFYLRKVLLTFTTEFISFWVLLFIWWGTNIPNYTLFEPMSHIYGFFLFNIILWFSLQLKNSLSHKNFIILGISLGLAILVRPTNALFGIIPLISFLQLGFKAIPINFSKIMFGIAGIIICLIPQFTYWHYMTGDFILYSYNNETFDFLNPEIYKALFSYRKGWFLYTPLALFGLIGFLHYTPRLKALKWPLLSLICLVIYISFSWWCWWYGGSFSSRVMIEYLAIIAIGLASILNKFSTRSKLFFRLSFGLFFILSLQSSFSIWQYRKGLIHHDSMSKELYWKSFGRTIYSKDFNELLDPPDYAKALKHDD